MFEMSSVSCNTCSQSLAQFPDCTVDHSLIKTVPLLLDSMAQLFHVLDLVPVNAVPQNHDTAKLTRFKSGLFGRDNDGEMKSVRALVQYGCLIIN